MTVPDVRAQAADLINNAIDVLHEQGLSCQGTYDDAQRPCVVAACSVADAHQHSTAWFAAVNAIQYECGERPIGDWSDASSIEDVLLVMKQAAASLREPRP